MLLENLQEAVSHIRSLSQIKPKVGITLGSGLGSFVDHIEVDAAIPYSEIPHFVTTTVSGHQGKLVLGKCKGVEVACLQGRVHYYEGHSMAQVVFPTRTLAMLGIENLILTNAAGSILEENPAGSFLIIKDHINLVGDNPLKGPNIKTLGPRFPDMSKTYDPEHVSRLEEVFTELKLPHAQGVYCGVSGPTYETPAEVEFLKRIGGAAVGMSTVPEAIAANHLGVRIAGISCLTNLAAGVSNEKLDHADVTIMAKKIENDFCNVLLNFLSRLNH